MAKKAAPKAAEPKAAAASREKKGAKPRTKAEIYAKLAESTGLSKKQISTVFDQLVRADQERAGQEGPRPVRGPGPAQAQGRAQAGDQGQAGLNPFTKQMMNVPAKPARNVVKALPLKSLKEMV